jgi:phage baseplate assembly protein gpV
MGLGKLLSFIKSTRNGAKLSEVKLDPGGGPNVTAEHFSAPGDDAHPLPGDYVVHVAIQRSGGSAVVGYLDTNNDQKAAAGEKRIYARDSDGASIVELWLKNDGTAVLENENGSVTLAPNGDITLDGAAITINGSSITVNGLTTINGAIISEAGEISTASGIDLDTHIHGGVTPGTGTTSTPQ